MLTEEFLSSRIVGSFFSSVVFWFLFSPNFLYIPFEIRNKEENWCFRNSLGKRVWRPRWAGPRRVEGPPPFGPGREAPVSRPSSPPSGAARQHPLLSRACESCLSQGHPTSCFQSRRMTSPQPHPSGRAPTDRKGRGRCILGAQEARREALAEQ